jgi:hypothetical protein
MLLWVFLYLPEVIHLRKSKLTLAGRKDAGMDNEIMKKRGNSSRPAKTERQYLKFFLPRVELKIGNTNIKRTKPGASKWWIFALFSPSVLFFSSTVALLFQQKINYGK